MKKYIPLRADVSDIKQAMRDVLREEKVLTQKSLETIPTIKEIEKTLESYPTKDDLRQELKKALEPYVTKDDLNKKLESYPTKTDIAVALEPIVSEIKKLRTDVAIVLGLKNQKTAFS